MHRQSVKIENQRNSNIEQEVISKFTIRVWNITSDVWYRETDKNE